MLPSPGSVLSMVIISSSEVPGANSNSVGI